MSLINITNNDLNLIKKDQQQLAAIDNKLLVIRKNAIFETLKAATEARIELIKRMKRWIDTLESKIFEADYMKKLSVKETMNLFKYINNANMRVLDKIDKLESVLNVYIKEQTTQQNKASVKKDVEGLQEIRKSVLDKVNAFLKTNTSDAVIVDDNEDISIENNFTDDIKKELEELDVDINKIDLDNL